MIELALPAVPAHNYSYNKLHIPCSVTQVITPGSEGGAYHLAYVDHGDPRVPYLRSTFDAGVKLMPIFICFRDDYRG